MDRHSGENLRTITKPRSLQEVPGFFENNMMKGGIPPPTFSHPDFAAKAVHRRCWNHTSSAEGDPPFADCTAGKELHLAPKIICWYHSITE